MKRIAFGFCALALIAMISTTASATTFMSDSFSYPNGDLTVYDGSGNNVSGGRWKPHSGTGFPIPIEVSGGQAVLAQGNPASEDANSPAFNASGQHTIGLGETWYYGAVVTVNDTRAGSGASLENQSYFIHFRGSTGGFVTRAHVTDPSTGVGGAGFRFGLSATSGIFQAATADLNFGQTYKIVGSYAVDTGATQLWVDPVNSGSPSIAHTDPAAAFAVIDTLALRQDFISSGNRVNVLVDSVALGDDFDSVLANSMNGSNIPEPASMALALLGLAGIASTRRRS